MSVWFREKIQALLWWRDNSLRVKLRFVLSQAPVAGVETACESVG